VAQDPTRYELHHQDETHLETNPYLGRVWHRIGEQPTVPAAGTNRRVTDFGSVELFGRGRVEVLCATQDSAAFLLYVQALDARHAATDREIFLVLDNGPCHRSKASLAALAERAAWLHVIWLARYSPDLNRKEARPIYYRDATSREPRTWQYHRGTPRPSARRAGPARGAAIPRTGRAALGDRTAGRESAVCARFLVHAPGATVGEPTDARATASRGATGWAAARPPQSGWAP